MLNVEGIGNVLLYRLYFASTKAMAITSLSTSPVPKPMDSGIQAICLLHGCHMAGHCLGYPVTVAVVYVVLVVVIATAIIVIVHIGGEMLRVLG